MICPEYLTAGLEAAFSRIQRERMADVPILNPALEVQAVGFRNWEEHCLGVLITPWFMNLMLLPLDSNVLAGQSSGDKVMHEFPSGRYEFIYAEEDDIGHYQMCSLFSPVLEFQNQQAAVATAEVVMNSLMDEANRDDVSTREREIQNIWSGKDDAAGAVVSHDMHENRLTLKERVEKPMGRRDMLRGAFLRREE